MAALVARDLAFEALYKRSRLGPRSDHAELTAVHVYSLRQVFEVRA
jgi:hypothetical protein